jgi:hypothetical protein
MGLGLQKPQSPAAALVLAISAPSLYTSFLRWLERQVPDPSLGAGLKAYGVPLFIVGHALQCVKRQTVDITDISYIVACTWLDAAFWGTYLSKPFPEGVLLAGSTLYGFGLPSLQRCLKAGLSPSLPILASLAATTLVWLGMSLVGLKRGLIKQAPPGLTPPQYAQLASSLFGFANFVKYFQLVQANGDKDLIYKGQALKCVASSLLFTGNALGLKWQETHMVAGKVFNAAGSASAAALLAPTSKAKSS